MRYRINYSKVVSQAQEISWYAERLSSLAEAITQLEQECKQVWRGDAASAFLNKLEMVRGEIDKTSRQISTLSRTIKSCADRIQREDEEAAKRAAAMSSGFSSEGGGGGIW